ncbi:rod shape-determining protein MreC [Tolypothrix campylonemoides VB511288]|nr:rod shape-determining protein MreC [Tolypothrix campylonemoides VB511288]
MPSYAGPSAARPGDVAGTLRLLAYLAAATVLIVLDHRGGWLNQVRRHADAVVQPLWMLAGAPGRLVERVQDDAGTLAQLTQRNAELRRQRLLDQARMARLQALAADNARLRGLLDAAERGNLDVLLVPILDVDLDPTRQRIVLDAGGNQGLRVGQSVIDAGGLLGQVTGTTPLYASVLLVTDPAHAVPVVVVRNGVRLVAYGTGRSDRLALTNVPTSSDVKVGDVLVTSGLGGRFAPGFPVGTVTALRPDESRAYLVGDVAPAAQLDRGRDVLVQLSVPPPPPAQTLAFDTEQRDSGLGTRDWDGRDSGLGTRDSEGRDSGLGTRDSEGLVPPSTRPARGSEPAQAAAPTTRDARVPSPESRVPPSTRPARESEPQRAAAPTTRDARVPSPESRVPVP